MMSDVQARIGRVFFMVMILVPAPLLAQARQPARPQELQQRIEEAFARQLQRSLALSDQEMIAVGAVLTKWGDSRRILGDEERRLREAIQGQLRPGIAASTDSLQRSIDRLLQNRVEYAESSRGEMDDLTSLLSPIQRAQYLMMRDQLLTRARGLIQQRRPPPDRQ